MDSTLTLDQCKAIYDHAVQHNACKGNIAAAKRYLDTEDIEGFERVCRGNNKWLRGKGAPYVLTDGPAEAWHDNGICSVMYGYVDGEVHGLYRTWWPDGQLAVLAYYSNGKLHGALVTWRDDGALFEEASFWNGRQHGRYRIWSREGKVKVDEYYIDGLRQPDVDGGTQWH
jgi:antitoxin component YwqK of YwqJK toxin-antitoxin module